MKTLKLIVLGILLFFAGSTQAQISVNLNFGNPPQWGPSGYSNVRYYYLPDVEAYYDVPSSMFIYFNGFTWIHRSTLPNRYRNYDLYHGYKVVMTGYHGKKPYSNFNEYKVKYAKGYHGQPQKNYGERPENAQPNKREYTKANPDHEYREGYYQGNKQNNSKNKNAGHGHGNDKD